MLESVRLSSDRLDLWQGFFVGVSECARSHEGLSGVDALCSEPKLTFLCISDDDDDEESI